jgi:hypothetical protein
MNSNINIDSTITESMNSNINIDSTITESKKGFKILNETKINSMFE